MRKFPPTKMSRYTVHYQWRHWLDFEEQCYVKHQSIFVVIKTMSKESCNFRSGAAPLLRSSPLFSDVPDYYSVGGIFRRYKFRTIDDKYKRFIRVHVF